MLQRPSDVVSEVLVMGTFSSMQFDAVFIELPVDISLPVLDIIAPSGCITALGQAHAYAKALP